MDDVKQVPRFSVVIPLYNKADTIERTLRSVAVQTFQDYEVIVVDDGSRDNGAEIVKNFKGISNLRLVFQSNSGVSTARNRGVAEAHAQYAAFLDADDEWHSDFLKEIDDAIRKFPGAPVYGSDYIAMGQAKAWVGRNWSRKHIRQIDFLKAWCRRCPIHTSSSVVRVETFQKIGGFNVSSWFYEDGELLFKLALAGQFVVVQRVLARYNVDATTRATEKIVNYTDLAHLNYLEKSLGEDASETFKLLPVARYEMRKLFVFNRLRKDFDKNQLAIKSFSKMARYLRWFDRLLLSRSLIGWMMAFAWRIWWLISYRIYAKCVKNGGVIW